MYWIALHNSLFSSVFFHFVLLFWLYFPRFIAYLSLHPHTSLCYSQISSFGYFSLYVKYSFYIFSYVRIFINVRLDTQERMMLCFSEQVLTTIYQDIFNNIEQPTKGMLISCDLTFVLVARRVMRKRAVGLSGNTAEQKDLSVFIKEQYQLPRHSIE